MILAHDDLGSGSAVLLLHAGVCDRRMWRDLLPGLSRAHRVVAPDLRGFGESPLPPGDFADADDVAALLDECGIAAATVVGSSLGGRVALELAMLHPERVSRLVLLCPAHRGPEPTAALMAFGDEEDRLLEAGDLAGAVDLNVRTWLGPEATDETRALVAEMQRHAFEVQLAAEEATPSPERRSVEVAPADIAVPTTVVTGGRDLDHFQAVGEMLAARIPGAEHVPLAWAGHLPSLERPDEVRSLLLDQLPRVS